MASYETDVPDCLLTINKIPHDKTNFLVCRLEILKSVPLKAMKTSKDRAWVIVCNFG